VRFSVDAAAVHAAASNSGTLAAPGGQVVMLASSLGDAMATVVNQTGVIRAESAVERDGMIVLSGGANGVTRLAGTLNAAGQAGRTGGTVHVLGDKVERLFTGQPGSQANRFFQGVERIDLVVDHPPDLQTEAVGTKVNGGDLFVIHKPDFSPISLPDADSSTAGRSLPASKATHITGTWPTSCCHVSLTASETCAPLSFLIQ